MKIYMLYETRLGDIPREIKEVKCFDNDMTLIVKNHPLVKGRSVVLEGPEESFVNWLRQFDHIWLGEGNPMEERFALYHLDKK